ncbi:MAG: radical SAM family heme chaperone HemW [Chloroflexota bacterium]|nr:radical SAM family heme chaperone HemW [Chloroflexota bacterium]
MRQPLTNRYPLSIYVHVPFCTTKCTYCAFNTYTNLDHLIPAYVDALCAEIAYVGERTPQPNAGTVFFGGGTPSLLTAAQYDRIFDTLHQMFRVDEEAEITLEANPNDLTPAYASALRAVGFNRISIGMQSANARELQLFRRRHGVDEVMQAVSAAREGGFDNINLDLIYGIPDQTRDDWIATLRQALALRPMHISLYALGIEEDTPMATWVDRGLVPMPDDDLAADMYADADALLEQDGFVQYEISNWARDGQTSRHNLQYWRSLPYLGLGPGGHGFVDGVRYATMLSPQRYIAALTTRLDAPRPAFPLTPAVGEWSALTLDDEISEMLIMGLRLVQEGIAFDDFRARFGVDLMQRHGAVFTHYAQHGLIDLNETHVRLTKRGRLLSNMVFRELV